MKLGGFGEIKDYLEISKAGFDFAELDIPEIEALSETDFENLEKKVKETGFEVLTGARLFPITDPLFFTDGFSPKELIPYLEKVCKRTSRLGICKIILGNGKARSIQAPEDLKKEPKFIEFVRMIADIAQTCGQELILEPLGPKYSNYLNTISEVVRFIGKVNRENVFTMADMRHMYWNEEPFENVVKYVTYIHHIHMDYPVSYPERKYPTSEDGYDYQKFLNILKKSGYDDTLTIEADIPTDWSLAFKKAIEAFGR